jgi:hypothetical protein
MAWMPVAFIVGGLLVLFSSGCATWHYRREAKDDSTSQSDRPGLLDEIFEDLSRDSLAGWQRRPAKP